MESLSWSLFAELQACNFIRKWLQHRCCPVSFAKFLRTPILKNIYCLLWTDFTTCPTVFIVDFEQVSGDWEANGVKTKQVRSIKNYFDIFIETMFAFLFHFITENYKSQSYCFERNNKIWCLNGYNFKLYQTMFHKKTVLFMVYKLLLKVH